MNYNVTQAFVRRFRAQSTVVRSVARYHFRVTQRNWNRNLCTACYF